MRKGKTGRQALPSAQSIISAMGRLARGIVVVSHHIGRPRQSTINQKQRITKVRLRVSDGVSDGGSLRPAIGEVVAGGLSAMSTTSLAIVADMAAASYMVMCVICFDVADAVVLKGETYIAIAPMWS